MAKYQLVLETVGNADLETIPVARSGHRCVTDGVFLYSFGGFNPNTVSKLFYKKIWCFHLSTRRWYNVWTESYGFGSVPTCVASSVMILHKGRFIVFGGSGYPFGTHNSDKMFQCDPKEQRWMVLNVTTEVGKPTPGYGQGVVIGQEEYLYIFGGTRGLVYNNNLHKFDFKSCTWELISCQSPPSGRYRHEMVSIDNGFVVIGGYGSSGACPLDKLPVYNYDAHTWNEVQCQPDEDNGFPKPRRAHSCVIFEDNVYVCGGFEEDNSSDKIFNDIWKLNVRTFLWSRIPQVDSLMLLILSMVISVSALNPGKQKAVLPDNMSYFRTCVVRYCSK